jgi:hypothetical protein
MYCVLCTEIETQKSAPIYLRDTKAKVQNFAHSTSAARVLDLTENYFLERNWVETLTKSMERELNY